METLVLHELHVAISIANMGGTPADWRTPSGSEVDFVWTRRSKSVGIEVKASTTWRSEFGVSLEDMRAERVVQRAFGVYLGREALKRKGVDVLPLVEFMRLLAAGDVLR